jgi:hypothetical protein
MGMMDVSAYRTDRIELGGEHHAPVYLSVSLKSKKNWLARCRTGFGTWLSIEWVKKQRPIAGEPMASRTISINRARS